MTVGTDCHRSTFSKNPINKNPRINCSIFAILPSIQCKINTIFVCFRSFVLVCFRLAKSLTFCPDPNSACFIWNPSFRILIVFYSASALLFGEFWNPSFRILIVFTSNWHFLFLIFFLKFWPLKVPNNYEGPTAGYHLLLLRSSLASR